MTCKDKILSDEYIDLVIDFPLSEFFDVIPEESEYCYQKINQNIAVLSLHENQLPLDYFSAVDFQFFPDLLGLQVAEKIKKQEFFISPLIEAGVVQAQKEPLNLTGRGVIVGFIDTGINWNNEIFKRADGTTRILSIWDQTIQTGNPPFDFQYGTEYTKEMIENQNVTSVDESGHGTVMASVACGSALNGGSDFLSPAYQSDIIMVKVKNCKSYLRDYYLLPESAVAYQSNDIMMAIRYLDLCATKWKKPIIICIGMGTNYRDHSGNGILSRYINSICEKRNRVIVLTGGNEGNAGHHFRGLVSHNKNLVLNKDGFDTFAERNKIEIEVTIPSRGFLLQIWAQFPVKFDFLIETPSGAIIQPTQALFQPKLRYRFLYENTVISVFQTQVDRSSGTAFILLRFDNPGVGLWTVKINSQDNFADVIYDAWLPINDFIQGNVTFITPSVDTTMTTPAYAKEAIVTSTYNSYTNSFYLFSGRGFGRNNELKPDLTSPGVDISAVGNRLGKEAVVNTYSGGSLSAAILAGAASQFMQWAVIDNNLPYVRSNEVKNYFIRGATRDAMIRYPNPKWGFGKLNVAGIFDYN